MENPIEVLVGRIESDADDIMSDLEGLKTNLDDGEGELDYIQEQAEDILLTAASLYSHACAALELEHATPAPAVEQSAEINLVPPAPIKAAQPAVTPGWGGGRTM